jgi:hypothetical protein
MAPIAGTYQAARSKPQKMVHPKKIIGVQIKNRRVLAAIPHALALSFCFQTDHHAIPKTAAASDSKTTTDTANKTPLSKYGEEAKETRNIFKMKPHRNIRQAAEANENVQQKILRGLGMPVARTVITLSDLNATES